MKLRLVFTAVFAISLQPYSHKAIINNRSVFAWAAVTMM